MKKILSFFAWLIGIPLFIAAIFALFGFLAIRFDFWPPSCSAIPMKEPRRVCEFSKLNKAPKGKPATVTFWLTVPANTPAADKVYLAVAGQEPAEMEKINSVTFKKMIQAITGDSLKYKFQRGAGASVEKTWTVRSLDKTVYDYVSAWSDLPPALTLNQNLIGEVDMKDTWTINYNMNLFEDTRRNIDASMDRAVALGAKEFAVFSFIDMAGSKDNFTVKQTDSPYYHWRDAAITGAEMKTLAKKGKARGLKVVLRYNIGADYNQYYNVSPLGRFMGGQAGSGVGGDAAEVQAAKDFGRDEAKNKTWLERYFTQLNGALVAWGKAAEAAGIDAIDITPQYRPPKLGPDYEYADQQFSKIIKDLRQVYSGKIYGSNFAAFGGLRYSPLPMYINELDRLYVYVGPINVPAGANIETMKQAHLNFLNAVEADFKNYAKPLYLVMAESSYEGATSGKPGMEWGDYKEVAAAGYKEGWQEQADSYEAFFQALSGRTKFAGLATGYYWWDDLMAPKYVSTANNMEATIRSKPAEAVWKKWLLKN